MTTDWAPGEIVRALQRIEDGQAAINQKLDGLDEKYVTRGEHQAVVGRLDAEIGTLKAARPQWTAVGALVVSVLVALMTLIPLIK